MAHLTIRIDTGDNTVAVSAAAETARTLRELADRIVHASDSPLRNRETATHKLRNALGAPVGTFTVTERPHDTYLDGTPEDATRMVTVWGDGTADYAEKEADRWGPPARLTRATR